MKKKTWREAQAAEDARVKRLRKNWLFGILVITLVFISMQIMVKQQIEEIQLSGTDVIEDMQDELIERAEEYEEWHFSCPMKQEYSVIECEPDFETSCNIALENLRSCPKECSTELSETISIEDVDGCCVVTVAQSCF